MSTEAAFLAAPAEDPTDETTRLVFADWHDERGDPRAAWLRDPNLAAWSLPGLVDPIPRLAAAVAESPLARPILLRLGTSVVPGILQAHSDSESATRELILELLREVADNQPRLRELRQGLAGEVAQRQAAIAAVVELGREGLALLPEIATLVRERQIPDEVLGQLLEQPGVACPAVIRFLWNRAGYGNRGVAWELCHAIKKDGPHPSNVQILLGALNDGGDISEYATGSLQALGLAIVPQLLDSFEQAYSDSFDWWVHTLTAFGPSVVPLLLDAQDREFARHGDRVANSSPTWQGVDKALRELAGEGQLGEHVLTVVERLVAIARQGPSHLWFVFTTLCSIGPAARPAWPVVEPFLSSPSPHEREAALQFLAALGETEAYETSIASALSGGVVDDRLGAVRSLQTLARTAPERAAGLLDQASRDSDPEVRLRALEVLMSPPYWSGTVAVASTFHRALSDPEISVRVHAAYGLLQFVERAGEALPDLLRMLREDPSAEVRARITGDLAQVSVVTRTPEVLEAICAATGDPAVEVRSYATMVLRDWGSPLPGEAIQALIERLGEDATAANATYGLQRQPNLPPEAVGAIRVMLHGNLPCAILALETLNTLGLAFTVTDIPALERIQREGSPHHRAMAARHLANLASLPPA